MSGRIVLVIALALVIRAALFPFAENKHGDAPMRALVAERMVLEPAAAAVPRTYCQFGPLHTTVMRPFIAADPLAQRSSRLLSLLVGIAVFFPFFVLARRLIGTQRAVLASFVLAVSPLHIQASTTAASEALYLLLWVGALERLLAALESRRLLMFAIAGLLATLAAMTRYDAWLALPLMVLAAAWLMPRLDARSRIPNLPGLIVFSLCAALLPVAWLVWGARAGGDPLFFAHYITADHAGLAATAGARYGAVLGRLRQLGIWSLAFVAAMTLPGAILAVVGFRPGWRALSPAMRLVIVTALAPPVLYLGQGLLLGSFEPLARFALVPGTLLLPLAVATFPLERRRLFIGSTAALAAAFAVVIWLVATVGRDRIWAGAESMGALTRLDREDREVAAYLRERRRPGQPVMIEPLAFAEIGITHAAGVPWTESVSLIVTRTPGATVAKTLATTGAWYVLGYDREGGWPRTLPDWPPLGVRFGRWQVYER
jgi:hypothetical protein